LQFATPKFSNAQLDSFFVNNVSEYDSAGLFYFYPSKLSAGQLFSTYQYYFFDDTLNEMTLVRAWTDSLLHYDHYKYQQFYKDIKIEGAEFIEHSQSGFLKYAYGKVATFQDQTIYSGLLTSVMAYDSLKKQLNYYTSLSPAWLD